LLNSDSLHIFVLRNVIAANRKIR